jgi:alpha-N-acetylglucosaminidase
MQRKRIRGLSPIIAFTGAVLFLWIMGSAVFVFRSSEKSSTRVVDSSLESKPESAGAFKGHPSPKASSNTEHNPDVKLVQLQAARELLVRAVGRESSELFNMELPEVTTREHFEIEDSANGKILLRGSSGVALASALNWYLRYFCKVDTSWYSQFPLKLPRFLPPVNKVIRRDSLVQWSYYENVCTFSYTQAWWDWNRWEREIDWMAMSGINLPLSLTGQEFVMQRVFARFGVTGDEMQEYFTGPGFLAWNRMINIKGWAGPLPQDFIDGQMQLQRRILARERSLGMTPVLPAFSGGVPEALAKLHPSARFHRHGNWGGFEPRYCCVLTLSPEDPLFRALGKAFVEEVMAAYGTDHVYSADTFNENRPGAGSGAATMQYLRASSAAVYGAMADADPDAVWLMQGWLFMNDARFWQV